MNNIVKWVLLEKFCELTGHKPDTIRKNIRSGGSMFRFAVKDKGIKIIHINYEAWSKYMDDQFKMVA